jgi:enolase
MTGCSWLGTTPSLQRRAPGPGIEAGVANSILVKVNQIGTLTETLETVTCTRRLHERHVALPGDGT